jgi:hypothetical protein
MPHARTGRVIRHIWPAKTTCPAKGCGCTDYSAAGHSNSGRVRYRRCDRCETVYSVLATHREIDAGGPSSVIEPA